MSCIKQIKRREINTRMKPWSTWIRKNNLPLTFMKYREWQLTRTIWKVVSPKALSRQYCQCFNTPIWTFVNSVSPCCTSSAKLNLLRVIQKLSKKSSRDTKTILSGLFSKRLSHKLGRKSWVRTFRACLSAQKKTYWSKKVWLSSKTCSISTQRLFLQNSCMLILSLSTWWNHCSRKQTQR